jgi:hypothetical protein
MSKTTTVRELRKALKEFPPDSKVVLVVGWHGGYRNIKAQSGPSTPGRVFITASEE